MIDQKENKVTFQIEALDKPENLLATIPFHELIKGLMLSDLGFGKSQYLKKEHLIANHLIANSKIPENLVDFGYHAFFNGLHCAYAEHRPFVLSPDMIWLLILQGFANHIKNNSEKLRHLFVNFEGKLTLVVQDDRIDIDNLDSPWELIFPEFTDKIKQHINPELVNN